jgi:hypothetical protein
MMVGIGIFATFGAATEAAGSGILVAILLGGSVALATGMSGLLLFVSGVLIFALAGVDLDATLVAAPPARRCKEILIRDGRSRHARPMNRHSDRTDRE